VIPKYPIAKELTQSRSLNGSTGFPGLLELLVDDLVLVMINGYDLHTRNYDPNKYVFSNGEISVTRDVCSEVSYRAELIKSERLQCFSGVEMCL